MNRCEHRSVASRLYRALLDPDNVKRGLAAGLVTCFLAAAAAAIPAASPVEAQAAEAALYWRIFMAALAAVGSILLIFSAGMALGARFVAEPAAAKLLKAHVDAGAAAHGAFVSREEWDRKHEAITSGLAEVRAELVRLGMQIDAKRPRK